jgi:hypothetical protein
MFRHPANQKIKPRKPLIIFIENIFRVAMKTITGFPMGQWIQNILVLQGFVLNPIPVPKSFVKVFDLRPQYFPTTL